MGILTPNILKGSSRSLLAPSFTGLISGPHREGLILYAKNLVDNINISSTTYLRSRAAVDVPTYSATVDAANTYYAAKIGGTWKIELSAWPTSESTNASTNDIKGAMVSAGAGKTVVIAAGTYLSADISAASGGKIVFPASGMTLRGAVDGDPDHSTYKGTVILDGTGITETYVLAFGASNASANLSDITVQNALDVTTAAVGGITSGYIENCIFKNNARHLDGLGSSASTIRNVRRNIFAGSLDSIGADLFCPTGTGTVNITHNIFMLPDVDGGDTDFGYGPGIIIQGTGTYNIFNNVFIGTRFSAVAPFGSPASGTLAIKNNIALGCGADITGTGRIFSASTGQTSAISNNIISISGGTPEVPISNADTETGNIYTSNSDYVSSARQGYIAISVDDASAVTFETLYGTDGTDGLAAMAQTAGVGLTWMVDSQSMQARIDDIEWAISMGVEIGCHTRTHSDLTFTGKIFDVVKDAETITVDRAADTITLSGGGSVAGFRAKTLAAIKTELEALGATVTPVAAYHSAAVGTIQSIVLGESIADVTDGNTIDCLVGDHTEGFVFSEVSGSIDEIEVVTGAGTITSFAYPFGSMTETVQGIIRQIKNGQITVARHTVMDANSSQHLSYLNRYAVGAWNKIDINTDTTSGDSAADVTANINGLMSYLAENGAIVSTYAHGLTEISLAQWQIIVDEIVKWSGKVTYSLPLGQAMAEIIANGTDSGNGYISRSWTDSSDYQLTVDQSGVAPFTNGDGDQYDAAGYKVWSDDTDAADYHAQYGWSIGAYQYPHAGGNPAKCYYHMEIVSGTTWDDLVIKVLPFSELVSADDGTLFTTLTPNSIDATERATWTGDQFFFDNVRGMGIYSEDLTGTPLAKADRYFGTGE